MGHLYHSFLYVYQAGYCLWCQETPGGWTITTLFATPCRLSFFIATRGLKQWHEKTTHFPGNGNHSTYIQWWWLGVGLYGYGSIPIHTIFRGMNIHLPAILMWTTGVQGFDTLPYGNGIGNYPHEWEAFNRLDDICAQRRAFADQPPEMLWPQAVIKVDRSIDL